MAGLQSIFEKIVSKDKDYRYMATSDLLNELQKETLNVDGDVEKKICNVVLTQMEDASGDISNLAVKCLAPLVKRVPESRLEEIVDELCRKLLHSNKEQQRDIGSIGLKTVVSEISSNDSATCLVRRLSPKLGNYLAQPDASADVKSECLDILSDMIHRFGGHLASQQELLRVNLLPQLDIGRAGLRKRAIACIAGLTAVMPDGVLTNVCEHVITRLKEVKDSQTTRTYIQMVGAISKSVGYRFGKCLPAAVPIVLKYCTTAAEGDDEMRESALQALESFVLRCPREVSPHVEAVLALALDYLKYDPNFADDSDGDDEEMDLQEEEEEAEEDNSDGEYSDDEDSSWKTRRAAARCLSAVILSRPEMLAVMYEKACPVLVQRFREREESVKIDVFAVFVDLLRVTGAAAKGGGAEAAEAALAALRAEVGAVVRAMTRQLKEKSLKTKVMVFTLLKELVMVLPKGLSSHLDAVLPPLIKVLSDKASSSNLRIEALLFLRLAMASHAPEAFHPHLAAVAPVVYAAVAERYYKVTSEALRVCSEMIDLIDPKGGGAASFDYAPYVEPLYTCVLTRLTAQDQDQEVKECAIMCMGRLVAVLGGSLKAHMLSECLPMLLDRLRNEITRLAAVKAFATISAGVGASGVDLAEVMPPAVMELSSFLRKANRALRTASLHTLLMFVEHQPALIPADAVVSVVNDSALLVNDADLQLSSHVLVLCNAILVAAPAATPTVVQAVLPPVLALCKSSLLQGSALVSLQRFFAALVQTNTPTASFEVLLKAVMGAGHECGTKQAGHSVALCVAGLCLAAGSDKTQKTVQTLIQSIKTPKGPADQVLALLCVGEIGRRTDLSVHVGLEGSVTECFASPSEEVKGASAHALGSITVGNLARYLPYVLAQINGCEPKLQYHLLFALKEVITTPHHADQTHVAVVIPPDLTEQIMALLLLHSESSEEGVRNVVADCLGKLALRRPVDSLPVLAQRLSAPNPSMRATMVMALKFTMSDRPQLELDAALPAFLPRFLALIEDPDRHVRRAAVQALQVGCHHKAPLLLPLLPSLLPLLYQQTIVRPELVRTVDLGPFKHIVDDGLELRKSAFECMETLLDHCLGRIDTHAFLLHLKAGLADHYDVKLPCHLVLARLAVHAKQSVLAVLDELVEPMEKTLALKLKQDAVKQEVDRNEDMLRSCLRAIDALSRMEDVETCQRFQTFMKTKVLGVEPMATRFAAVRLESSENSADGAMDIS